METTWFGFDPSNVSLPSSHSAAPALQPSPSASSSLHEHYEDIRSVVDPFGGDLLTELLPEVSPMSEYAQSPSRPWNGHGTVGEVTTPCLPRTAARIDVFTSGRKPLDTIHESPLVEPRQQQDTSTRLEEISDEITIHAPPNCVPISPHRLHCRICNLDPCNNITATICGHIFCNM